MYNIRPKYFLFLPRGNYCKKVKGKGALEPKAQTAGAYPGFFSMKHA